MTLDSFQLDTLDFLDKASGRAVIADPMGARKTGTTLAWLQRSDAERVLIVAPSAVHRHWEREAARFASHFEVCTPKNGKSSKDNRYRAIERTKHQPSIYITTYEAHKLDQDVLLTAGFDTIVYDEGHRLKGRRTQVALAANDFAKATKHCIILTGTPVLNHASELWQYLHMMAPKEYRSFWRWTEDYFHITYARFQGRQGPETKIIGKLKTALEQELRDEIAPWFLQRDLSELFPDAAWIEEPEHVAIECRLSNHERKVYDNLVKHKWGITSTGHEITTQNPLDLSTRLQQISSDWGTLDDQLTLGSKSGAAVELIADLIERDEPVVVFAKYKATVARIVESLRKRHVNAVEYITDAEVQSFRTGSHDVLVGTLAGLSEGVDGLQSRCSTVVMVDRHWTAAKNDQAIGRVKRSGQERKVTVYHVYAEDTIDTTVVKACLDKVNVIQVLRDKPLIDAIYGR